MHLAQLLHGVEIFRTGADRMADPAARGGLRACCFQRSDRRMVDEGSGARAGSALDLPPSKMTKSGWPASTASREKRPYAEMPSSAARMRGPVSLKQLVHPGCPCRSCAGWAGLQPRGNGHRRPPTSWRCRSRDFHNQLAAPARCGRGHRTCARSGSLPHRAGRAQGSSRICTPATRTSCLTLAWAIRIENDQIGPKIEDGLGRPRGRSERRAPISAMTGVQGLRAKIADPDQLPGRGKAQGRQLEAKIDGHHPPRQRFHMSGPALPLRVTATASRIVMSTMDLKATPPTKRQETCIFCHPESLWGGEPNSPLPHPKKWCSFLCSSDHERPSASLHGGPNRMRRAKDASVRKSMGQTPPIRPRASKWGDGMGVAVFESAGCM